MNGASQESNEAATGPPVRRALLFTGIFVLLYGASIFILPQVKVGSFSLMKLSTRNPVTPGGFGFTAQRFEDVKQFNKLDILFLGSSHAYRSYDPRLFQQEGLSVFNMGTTGQTPLNSYFLVQRYWEQLQPDLVVLDLVYRVIDRDGLECFYDLSANMDYSPDFLQMALEINNPHAINGALGMWSSAILGREQEVHRQALREGERYVSGGYVELTEWGNDSLISEHLQPRRVIPDETQMRFIEMIIDFVQQRGAKILLVTKPEPRENLPACENYPEISAGFAAIAAGKGVLFWDFNREMEPLDWFGHFHDREYLSPPGVQIYNRELLRRLREAALL